MPSPPDFVTPAARPSLLKRLPWVRAAIIVLTLTLGLQVVLADRARLATDARWRRPLLVLCSWFDCTLPPWHQPEAIHITSRDVGPHPRASGVLLVNATLRNDAAFAQAWPQLQLSLSNLDGEPLGLRRFSPREYLGGEPATALLAPGQSAAITLEIVDPGKSAVAFAFEFR